MKLTAVFLCGDRSPYGIAHLEAIAEHFELKALVVADKSRWTQFRYSLSGGETYRYGTPSSNVIHELRRLLKWAVSFIFEELHQRRLKKIGVPVYVVNDVNSPSTLNLIGSLMPQVLISAAYPQIFAKTLLDLAPRGAINFHPSLLPRCRGAHPHYWCLATGEKLGGVSAHFMTERIDDGDIIAQRAFELEGFYYDELYKKIIEETPFLVASVASFLSNKDSTPNPQDESLATTFRNDREIHRRLDFLQMSSRQLHNRVRAGGAYGIFRGKRVQITRMQVASSNRHMTNGITVSPGVIIDIDNTGVWVATNDQKFVIINKLMSPLGIMDFGKWVAKASVQIGEKFE